MVSYDILSTRSFKAELLLYFKFFPISLRLLMKYKGLSLRVGIMKKFNFANHLHYAARDSSVGIASRYGLEGPGIESRWGARFSAPVQTGPGAHTASYTTGTGSLSEVKAAGGGRGVDLPPHLGPRLKKE
jgi:hypothetical protein